MTKLRNVIDKISGMRYMVEELELCSSLGKRHLLSSEYIYDSLSIAKEVDNVSELLSIIENEGNNSFIEGLKAKLSHILDIRTTLCNISNTAILDDIELFEIKRFALLSDEISKLLLTIDYTTITLPSLEEVVDILDPDKKRVAYFYIYPSYNPHLADLRKRQEDLKDKNPDEAEKIRLRCIELEDEVRKQLSFALHKYSGSLIESLEKIAYIDVLLAKAIQAKKLKLCKPKIAEKVTTYDALVNPHISKILALSGKKYQPIDISLYQSPCLITGANMAGKTLVLKTIALAQYLFHFGFYIPASRAEIIPVEDIMMSIGDEQSELNGLSSFAAEMLNINAIIKSVHAKKKILALIDEPARTTNPEEGKAIVSATLDILQESNIQSLVTTHYNGLDTSCRKLRVKGLMIEKISSSVTIDSINNYIDYSLIENNDDIVPMEALRIASILGVDSELLEKANKYKMK